MYSSFKALAVLFMAMGPSLVHADGCTSISGMTYCTPVAEITYNNVGFSGTYNDVTNMDTSSCECSSSPYAFSGPLAPFNEELSLHFRGPLQIAELAVYTLGGSSLEKRGIQQANCVNAQHPFVLANRTVVITETFTEVVDITTTAASRTTRASATSTTSTSSTSSSSLSSSTSHSASSVSASSSTISSSTHSSSLHPSSSSTTSTHSPLTTTTIKHLSSSSSSSSSSVPSSSSTTPRQISVTSLTSQAPTSSSVPSSGSYQRESYFNAQSGGTNGSGSWSSCFGNTLSYSDSTGVGSSSSPEVLGNVIIPSDKEVILFSGQKCTSTSDCGYYQPDTPAYHGFGGADKVFLMRFSMPTDTTSASGTPQLDMPAIWLLNAKIPWSLQYGQADCSCWTTGCGELDLFEALYTHSPYLLTTLHSWQGTGNQYGGGGSSDYFQRPTSSLISVAVIFSSADRTIRLIQIPSSTSFASSLSTAQIASWTSSTSANINLG